ncbi:uncharacterized protein LOC127731653 isoform X1 [Mytilus californianus]|uniref:uncharacterized protein LOC127731653 isoform X1 n=1 Tax=Mytilus californianus TaxID=6549 RepID=UPI0022485D10|nr:uncharacterized protein LOC127731653 isoform X1 [Mytilus californianus]
MLDKIKILIGLKFSWFVIVIIIVPTIGFNQHYKSSAKPIKISTKDGVLFCGSSRIHGNASLHGRCSPCGAINSDETSLLSKSKYDVNGEIAHINFSIHSSINGQLYFRFCEISNLKHCLKNDKVYIKESSERMYNFSAGNQTVSLHLHIPKQFNNGQYLLQSNVILNLVHLVNCVPVITNNNADKHSLQINEERRTIDMEPDGLIDGYEGLHDHNLPENHWTDQQNNSNGINYKQKKTLLEIPDNELAALDNYNNTVQNNVDTKNAEELSQHHEASSSQFYRNTRENVFTSVIGAIFDYFKGKSGNSSRDTKLVTQEDYVWKDGKDNKTINLITIDGLNSSVINKQIDKNSYIVGHGAGRESYETPEPLLVHNISFNTDSIANEINVERNGSYVHVSGFIENVTDVLDEKNQDYRHGTKNEIISNAINLYGIAIPPTDTNINSLHDKEDTNNGKIEEVGNYINAQFTQIEELSNKKSVVRTGKHQVAIGRKDLMEIYQHTNHHNVIHQQKTDSSTKRNNEITSINHNNDSVKEGPAFSWLSGKSAEVRNSGTMFVPTFEAIDPIEHSGIHRPALAFAKNTNSVSRKRIKKKKRKKSKRKSKTRLRKTKTDHTKKETLSQPVTKSIQKSKTTSIKPISQSKVKSIQSAVEPRKDVSKVSNSFNQLEQLVNLVMSTKGKQKHQNVQLKKKQRQDVPKVSNKYNKLKQLVSLVKSVKEPKAFGETHKSAKFRTDVKHVFGTLGKKKLQQGAERKMKPLANFIPKSYGINIKSANKELKVNEQKYQVHKQAKPSIKRILNAKRYQIKSSNHKGKQNLNYIVTSKGDSVSKTNNTTLQLDPDYIVTGSMDLNGTNNHLFTNEKGQTSTHKFASHIINDLVQRGFLEENHASGMSTAPGSPLKISKPNAKFIDEQFRKPNNKHSIKILPSSQTPERDYFKISPRSTNSDYSEVIHSTVEPVPSPKPSVITELMKMGFIDKYTLPIIDIRKSNDTHIKPETGSRSKSNSSQYTVLETKEKANNFNEQTVNGYIASKKIVGKKGKNKPKEKNMNEQNPNAQNLLSKDLKILDLLKMGFIDKETLSLIDLIKSNVTRVTQDIDKADLEVTKSLRENFQSSAKVLINSKATEQNHISTSSNIDSTKESNKKEGMQTNKQIVPSDFKLSNILKGDAKTITDNQKHRENNEKTISKDNKILELMKMGFIDEATLPIIDLTKSDVIKVTSKTGDLELKSTKENKQINRLNSERVNIVNRDEQLMSKDKTTGKIYSQSELIDLVLKDGTEKLKDIEVREHDKQTQDTSNIEGEAPLKTDKVNKKYNSLKSKKLPKRKTKLKFNETIDSTQNAHLQFNKSVDVNDKKKGKIQDTIINKENIIIKDVESDNANTQLQLNMSQAERQINQSRKSLNIKKIDHQQFIASIIKKQKKKWKKKSRRRMKNKTKSRIQTSKENLSKFVIGAQTNESVLEFEKSARMNVIAKSEIGTLDNEDVKDQLKFNNSFTGSPMNLKDSLQNAPKKAKKSRSRKKKKTPNEDKSKIANSNVIISETDDSNNTKTKNEDIIIDETNNINNESSSSRALKNKEKNKNLFLEIKELGGLEKVLQPLDKKTFDGNPRTETNNITSEQAYQKQPMKNESNSSDQKSDKDDHTGNTTDSGNVGEESVLKTSSLEGQQKSPTKIKNKLYSDNVKLTIKHNGQSIKTILQRINDLKSKTLESELLLSLALDQLSKSGNVERVVKTDHNVFPINTSLKSLTENLTSPLSLDQTIEATNLLSAENKEMFFETDLTSPVSQSAGNKNIKIRKMSTSKLPSKEDFLDTQKLNPHAIKGIPKSLLKHDVDMIIQKTVLSGRKTKTSKKVTGKSTRPKTKTKKTKAVTSSKHKSKDDRKLLPVNLNTLDYTSQTNINNSEPSKLDLHSESEIIKSNEHLKTVNIPMSTTSKVNSTSQRSENTDKNEVKYEEGEQSLKLSNQNEESTNDTTKITKHERKEISEIGEEDSTIKSKKTISKDISPTNKSSLSSRDSTLHATNIPNKKQQTVISELIVPNQMLSDKSSDKLPPIKSGSLINIKQREHQTLSRLNTSQHVYTNKTTTSISPQQTRNETLLNENEMQSIKIQNLMNQTLDGVETKQVSSSEILDTSVIDKSPLENTLDVQGNQESVDSNITMWSTETKDNSTSLADNDEKNTAEVFQDNLPTVERNIIKTHEDLKDRLTPRDRNVSRSSTEKQTRQNLSDRNESKTTKGNKGKITMVETVTSKEHSDRVLLGDRNVTKTTKDENENDFINQKKENDFIKQKKENDFIKQKKENDFIKQLRDLKERMMSEAANDKSSTVNSEDRLSSVDIMVKGRNMKKEENASLRTSVAPKYELHLNGEGALQYNHSPLVSKPDLVDMYKEMNYSDPKLKVPDTSSYNNRRNKKYPQIHSVPSGRGKVNSVSYSAILRSFRKEGGNQPMLNRPNIVGEQFLGASSQFDYPTSTSQQNLVLAEQQGTTTTVPTSVDSSGLVSARVDQTENTKWASLASGIMQRDKKAPGVVIDNKRTSIVGGKQWPALVAQHLQWTDTAPNSMSLSMGHNTDGRYISDPFTGKDRHIGTIDKVNSGMHLNGKGVSNLRPKQRKTVDNDQQFENILNSLVDVAMESSYLAQEQRGGIVDQTMGRVVDKAIKTQTRKGNPATPMYSKWDRHGTMHNNDRDMINNYRISSVPLPQNIDRNPNTDVNRIKDQNSVDLSLGYQQTTSTQPPNLFMYGKSQNYWWHDRQVRGPSDVLTFSGANLPLNSMRRRIGNKPVNSVKSTILNSKVSKADINRSSPRVRNDRILKVATEPDIVLLNRKPDIGLHSSEPGIELHSRRAIDLHNKEEIQTTDVNLNNKPSQIYSNIELPGLKAPGLQIRSMETPKKKNIQFGGLFVAQNAANEQQERIKMQDEPNRAIRPHQRLTNKKTIHLMPGILGAHDILSLQNQHNSQPDVTDLHTPTVPYSRLVPQNQYHNTIPGTPNYGFPFEMSLLQFQHARNQGTRRIRVRSPQEMAKTQIHYDAGLANKVSSNNLNPNDYAYEYPGQPHEVVVNINIMKNLSNVCAPDERFTCNPVENNVAVSELRSLCISSCNQGYCPVDKCSCFCVSLTTLDVKNIIVESNKVVPSKQTNLLGHILENSGTNTPKLPKTVNIIGMNSDISGTTSPKNSNTMNIIGMKAGNLGTGSPKPSKTVNIIGMNAENSINGFPAPFKTENNIGMNAENLGTGSPSPPKTVNIIGMNAETSGTAPPTPSNTLNMIGMVRSNPLPHEVLQIPRVTCTVTSLFLSIKGMIDWCNTECNISLNNCPMHICDCQFIL